MEKTLCLFLFLFVFIAGKSQGAVSYKDVSFQSIYKQISLRSSVADGKKIIRKWDREIKIFGSYGITVNMKEELEKTIRTLNPLLGNIKIVWVAEQEQANFIIAFDKNQKTTFSLVWDIAGNIQKGTININKEEGFNEEELSRKAQQFLLKSLGNFAFKDAEIKEEKAVKCLLAYYKTDISPFDLEVIKLHYSKGIETGMYEKDLEEYLKKLKK